MLYRNHERNRTLSPANMVLLTLRLFATGCFLKVVGDFGGVDKATVSRVVKKVAAAIANLRKEYISMPKTREEMQEVRQQFYKIAKFPRCIGAIDCTHIKIQSPGGQEAEMFRNRKGFFSYNVQVVCNANLEIQNIVARWPGSTHDSTIFQNSKLRSDIESDIFLDSLLVGDSGYSVRPYLISPLLNTTTPAENLFNESQIRTRNPIERLFGMWKRRFPILSLGIRTEYIEEIIVATAVLHNICILMKDDEPSQNLEIEENRDFVNNVNVEVVHIDNNLNEIVRSTLIREYFQGLL